MSYRTFTIIKPEIVKKGLATKVLDDIVNSGFQIAALKMTKMSEEQARHFYSVHEGKDFYEGLIRYITSGHVVVAVLKKENAVQDFRKMIGSTDPVQSLEGTLRYKYGTNTVQNAIHGSDSDENALIESRCFFTAFDEFINY